MVPSPHGVERKEGKKYINKYVTRPSDPRRREKLRRGSLVAMRHFDDE
jgi:hypothetical protein